MSDTTLQRFIEYAKAEADRAGELEDFQRAIPIAREIVLFADPLDSAHDAIGGYIQNQHAALDAGPDDPSDPDHECEKSAATENSIFYIGLAVGLLVADLVADRSWDAPEPAVVGPQAVS